MANADDQPAAGEMAYRLERELDAARRERDALRERARHLHASQAERFRFIDDHRDAFAVALMCQALEVSTSGYHAWRSRPPSKRELENRALTAQIKAIFDASGGTYGSPRIHEVLKERGVECGRNRVARLMREAGLKANQGSGRAGD
jgi:putative transposase